MDQPLNIKKQQTMILPEPSSLLVDDKAPSSLQIEDVELKIQKPTQKEIDAQRKKKEECQQPINN